MGSRVLLLGMDPHYSLSHAEACQQLTTNTICSLIKTLRPMDIAIVCCLNVASRHPAYKHSSHAQSRGQGPHSTLTEKEGKKEPKELPTMAAEDRRAGSTDLTSVHFTFFLFPKTPFSPHSFFLTFSLHIQSIWQDTYQTSIKCFSYAELLIHMQTWWLGYKML
ncbi:uncharacterized [Tachysurus ichikawai]